MGKLEKGKLRLFEEGLGEEETGREKKYFLLQLRYHQQGKPLEKEGKGGCPARLPTLI